MFRHTRSHSLGRILEEKKEGWIALNRFSKCVQLPFVSKKKNNLWRAKNGNERRLLEEEGGKG
jgi:hypothetical protein